MAKKTAFGVLVRTARKTRGWTQVQLAKKSKVSQATISGIESGVREPSEATIAALTKALKLLRA